jgi:hypothetical protein
VGVENKVAEALSRQWDDGELRSLIAYPLWQQQGKEISKEVEQDAMLQGIVQPVLAYPHSRPCYTVKGVHCLPKQVGFVSKFSDDS